MIFKYTLEQVRKGIKTRTSRLQKPNEILKDNAVKSTSKIEYEFDDLGNFWADHSKYKIKYRVGGIYKVQPDYGVAGTDEILITRIESRDVRTFTVSEIYDEGYENLLDFWHTWTQMYDKKTHRLLKNPKQTQNIVQILHRPDIKDARYQAWVYYFEYLGKIT